MCDNVMDDSILCNKPGCGSSGYYACYVTQNQILHGQFFLKL